MPGRLVDKVAIVTGGGTGIGNGVALALAHEGAKVVVCGRRVAPLERTVRSIQESVENQWDPPSGLPVVADVSNEEDVQRLVRTALETYGRIDILVNNAGVSGGSYVHEMEAGEWDRVMDINLRGPLLTSRAVLPHMRAARRGHIINISSESGIEYYQTDGAYGLSKHALNALGEYIQRENQELGIKVNTICPGMVVSEMTGNAVGLNADKCLYPEDIADLVIWLLSRRQNIKIGTPILIQTMENPWE